MSTQKKRTVLLYGRTNAGKTAQLAELAGDVFKRTGLKTRLYTSDLGGTTTIQPYIDLGIIDVVERGETNPWIFLNRSCQGMIKDANGKWLPGPNDQIGMFAFESLTSIADALMADMVMQAAKGISIGGQANISFNINDGTESLKVSGSNMAHYQVAQARIREEVWKSQKLPAKSFILWTASASKDDDLEASGKVVGPAVVGKAMTAEVPRWFELTFRIDVLPASGASKERHILYLGNHQDINAGNAAGLGNIRMPLDAPQITKNSIEPASIVEAINLIDKGAEDALESLRKKLNVPK